MRRGLKLDVTVHAIGASRIAARAAPYEKGTETNMSNAVTPEFGKPRARPPMRRGLKLKTGAPASGRGSWPRARPPMRRGLKHGRLHRAGVAGGAARAAPYEKGTETAGRMKPTDPKSAATEK